MIGENVRIKRLKKDGRIPSSVEYNCLPMHTELVVYTGRSVGLIKIFFQ